MSKGKAIEEIQMEFVKEELLQRDYSKEENRLESLNGQAKLTSKFAEVNISTLGDVHLYVPTFAIEAEIEKFRATQKYKLMKDYPELPTRKQMLTLLKERGEWGEVEEGRLQELNDKLEELEDEFKEVSSPLKTPSKEEQDNLLREIVKLRLERNELFTFLEGHMSSTIDGVVENMCKFYTLYKCAKRKDGTYLFNSYSEMMDALSEGIVNELFQKASEYWRNLRTDFLDSKPEVNPGESAG